MECDSVLLLYRNCSRALVEGWEEGRAGKEAAEEASAMEMDVDSRVPRNSEQKLMETKGGN